jgi:hypothetical protein
MHGPLSDDLRIVVGNNEPGEELLLKRLGRYGRPSSRRAKTPVATQCRVASMLHVNQQAALV